MEYELEADQDQESFAEMKKQKIYETKKKQTNKRTISYLYHISFHLFQPVPLSLLIYNFFI